MLQLVDLATILWMDALSSKKEKTGFDSECRVE